MARLFVQLCRNKSKLNEDELKVMILLNKIFNRDDPNIFFNGSRLAMDDENKYLGIYIDWGCPYFDEMDEKLKFEI